MKFLKVITCLVLVVSMMLTAVMPMAAARATYYLSDIKLAEADTEEEAKNLLTGAGYTVLDKTRNPDGDKAVYLGFKKSTNVDDAITDIRVMNMNGGFNVTDYETLKNDALQEYGKTIDHFRIAAKEFAENYKAGKKEALLTKGFLLSRLTVRHATYYSCLTSVLNVQSHGLSPPASLPRPHPRYKARKASPPVCRLCFYF